MEQIFLTSASFWNYFRFESVTYLKFSKSLLTTDMMITISFVKLIMTESQWALSWAYIWLSFKGLGPKNFKFGLSFHLNGVPCAFWKNSLQSDSLKSETFVQFSKFLTYLSHFWAFSSTFKTLFNHLIIIFNFYISWYCVYLLVTQTWELLSFLFHLETATRNWN